MKEESGPFYGGELSTRLTFNHRSAKAGKNSLARLK